LHEELEAKYLPINYIAWNQPHIFALIKSRLFLKHSFFQLLNAELDNYSLILPM